MPQRFVYLLAMVLMVGLSHPALAQLSDISWKAAEQINKHSRNDIKYDDEGYVSELKFKNFPSGFAMGQLSVFPRLESVSIDSRYYFEDATMGGIRKLKRLKKFELKNSRYATTATLEMLAEAPALDTLVIDDCNEINSLHELSRIRRLKHLTIIPDDALSYTPLVECRSLKSLKLTNSATVDDASIRELSRVTTLESIDLSGTKITDEGLSELGKLPNLEKLVLKKCKAITGEGFADFQHPESVKELDLEETRKLNDDGLKELSRFTNLEQLRLFKNKEIKGPGFECLGAFKKLKTLGCPNTAIADSHLKLLDGISSLELIWLPACPGVSGRGLDFLSASKGCKRLSVNECRNIDSPDFEILAKFTNLEELYVAQTRIRNEEIDRLCELKKLKILNIGGNIWLDDSAFEKLEGCAVEKLIATDLPRLTDAAFEHASKMKNLINLCLTAHRKLTGAGIKKFVGNEKMKYLTFEKPKHLTLEAMASVRMLPNIEELYFKKGKVTVAQLEQLSGMQNLRLLRYEVDPVDKQSERLISVLKTFPKLK